MEYQGVGMSDKYQVADINVHEGVIYYNARHLWLARKAQEYPLDTDDRNELRKYENLCAR